MPDRDKSCLDCSQLSYVRFNVKPCNLTVLYVYRLVLKFIQLTRLSFGKCVIASFNFQIEQYYQLFVTSVQQKIAINKEMYNAQLKYAN